MMDIGIPQGPQDLTAQWLTQALRRGETIQRANVLSFRARELGQEGGITGQLARLYLTYDIQEEGAPQTLIAKFPSADPAARASAKELRGYEFEVRFYRQIARQIELPTPRCYYSAMDETAAFVLLLQDLAPACVGDTLAGCAIADLELAIREVAKFHAAWWESPQLSELDWLPQWHAIRYRQYLQKIVQMVRERREARAQEGSQLSPARQELSRRIGGHWVDIVDYLELQPPRTLIHFDYHLDNLFFATPHGGVPFAVIDWQYLRLGHGVYDVAYLMCRSVSIEERRENEMDLLETYHTVLGEHGVEGYSFEQCLNDYRFSMLHCLGRISYILASLSSLSPKIRHRYGDVLLPRNLTAIQDLNAADLLPE